MPILNASFSWLMADNLAANRDCTGNNVAIHDDNKIMFFVNGNANE